MNPSAAFNAGVPAFGTWVLYAFLVSAALSFGLAVLAATDTTAAQPRYLRAARLTALATCGLIALDVLLLLYAFVSHDFRVRYVMRYSDRSMPGVYLITALWGGQDGSLLWWTFLLSLYTGACVLWLKERHRALAPYVIATLMVVVMFFGVLMAFAANPFSANVAGAPVDGEGLNPSLQNFYMAIHPPSLYVGFVGCAVPFAFAIAALLSGRLDEEWVRATRKWALFAWVFLSIGNTLGMLWAYEELGWGGFWAWDPVENAACMPWWTTTAYLHSFMIQERRNALKVWNVALVILSFLLTIFGTFLTRSGLIASIHSFAQSEIGVYFLYFLAFVTATSVALIVRRYAALRKPMAIDALLSREAMFVANNWLLLGMCVFIVAATTWPKIAEWLWDERQTVGPSFYNAWLPVPGALLLLLMGIGTLTPWRKGSRELLWKAFRGPVAVGALVALAHVLFGRQLGYPPVVHIDPISDTPVGSALAAVVGTMAPIFLGLVGFNLAAIAQEFYRGTDARARARGEAWAPAFGRLVAKNRRRYGGYVVHVGISLMFLGWTGTYWRAESEATLRPGESFQVERYTLRYDSVERHRDPNHQEIITRMTAFRGGREVARPAPAKFIYTTHPDMPTSEVSITSGLRDDLYVVMASVHATTRVAHIKAWVNPLTVWIWLGGIILVLGCAVAIWPEISTEWLRGSAGGPEPDGGAGGDGSSGGKRPVPAMARRGGASGAALVVALALAASAMLAGRSAHAQHVVTNAPPMVGGDSEPMTPAERRLFERLLCMCGGCQRLPLATCTCDVAARTRGTLREQLRAGVSPATIAAAYARQYGSAALAVPPDTGRNRAVYLVPLATLAAGAAFGVWIVRRWRTRGLAAGPGEKPRREEFDARVDEELKGLDDE